MKSVQIYKKQPLKRYAPIMSDSERFLSLIMGASLWPEVRSTVRHKNGQRRSTDREKNSGFFIFILMS